jgi:hypothetical protein
VFTEQYEVQEDENVVPTNKEEISSQSVQSPYDTDCTYRKKGGNDGQKKQEIKGYSSNITETCDEDKLNLITDVQLEPANTSDSEYVQSSIEKTQEKVQDRIEKVHADGAYHSPDNQEYCGDKEIELLVHAIQGKASKYEYEKQEDDTLIIKDTETQQIIENTKIIGKDGQTKWRIINEKGYRYITQKEIDAYEIRKRIAQIPKEELQNRNNVEATVFQFGYHCKGGKTKYRGIVKNRMWAYMRALWVNFVRINKYLAENGQKAGKKTNELMKLYLEPLQAAIIVKILTLSLIFSNHVNRQQRRCAF